MLLIDTDVPVVVERSANILLGVLSRFIFATKDAYSSSLFGILFYGHWQAFVLFLLSTAYFNEFLTFLMLFLQ